MHTADTSDMDRTTTNESRPDVDGGPAGKQSFDAVAPYYDHLMASVPYRFWLSYLNDLWALHNLSHHRILDLACGTGSMSRLLAERGCDVVGIDVAPRMIDVARRRAAEQRLSIQFLEQDAAEFSAPGPPFDSVISLFDSLNYLLQPERFAAACRRSHEHLADGGAFIFDLNTEYAFLQGMFNQSCSRRDEPLHYRWRSRYDQESRLCTVNMTFWYTDPDGEREQFKEVHRQRAYTKTEVTAFLVNAGFADVNVYDAYSTHPATPKSDRVFYVAKKS